MLTPPDKRAILIFVTIGVLAVINTVLTSNTKLAYAVEILLYLSIIFGGMVFVWLDLKEGYCLNRPDISREDFPIFFWLEIITSCFIVWLGLSKLIKIL